MHRLAPLTVLLPLLAPVVLAGPAHAGSLCSLSGSTASVQAPSGAEVMEVDATSQTVTFRYDGATQCTFDRADVQRIEMRDNVESSVYRWQVVADSRLPGPVAVGNDADDVVAVSGSPGPDRWGNVGVGAIDLDTTGGTADRVEVAVVPSVVALENLQGGGDVVNMRRSTPWPGGLRVEAADAPDRVVVRLGDGLDFVKLGRGDDLVTDTGGSSNVDLGGGADTAVTAAGLDAVYGRGGADTMIDPVLDDLDDEFYGGAGADTIDYSGRERRVWARVGDHTAFGTFPAYADHLLGVETLVGTASADELFGGEGHQELIGLGGRDRLTGLAGSDTLRGGAGADELRDRDDARDELVGGPGRDGAERDVLDVLRSIEYRLR